VKGTPGPAFEVLGELKELVDQRALVAWLFSEAALADTRDEEVARASRLRGYFA
jgi:hypothetical protein